MCSVRLWIGNYGPNDYLRSSPLNIATGWTSFDADKLEILVKCRLMWPFASGISADPPVPATASSADINDLDHQHSHAESELVIGGDVDMVDVGSRELAPRLEVFSFQPGYMFF